MLSMPYSRTHPVFSIVGVLHPLQATHVGSLCEQHGEPAGRLGVDQQTDGQELDNAELIIDGDASLNRFSNLQTVRSVSE